MVQLRKRCFENRHIFAKAVELSHALSAMARCSLAERNVRLFRKFSKEDLLNLKQNSAHPCQESIEMMWFGLFATLPFFRDGWTTVLS